MLKDFSISMPKIALHAGSVTFTVTNNGPSAHNLTITGPGVSNAATPTFASGGSKTLTVTLQKGTYDFFCSVPGHKAAGMNLMVSVA
jgi:plastocyanin